MDNYYHVYYSSSEYHSGYIGSWWTITLILIASLLVVFLFILGFRYWVTWVPYFMQTFRNEFAGSNSENPSKNNESVDVEKGEETAINLQMHEGPNEQHPSLNLQEDPMQIWQQYNLNLVRLEKW